MTNDAVKARILVLWMVSVRHSTIQDQRLCSFFQPRFDVTETQRLRSAINVLSLRCSLGKTVSFKDYRMMTSISSWAFRYTKSLKVCGYVFSCNRCAQLVLYFCLTYSLKYELHNKLYIIYENITLHLRYCLMHYILIKMHTFYEKASVGSFPHIGIPHS